MRRGSTAAFTSSAYPVRGATSSTRPPSKETAPSRTFWSSPFASRPRAARALSSSRRTTGSMAPPERKKPPKTLSGSAPVRAARSTVSWTSKERPARRGSTAPMRSPTFTDSSREPAASRCRSSVRTASARLSPPISTPRTVVPASISPPVISSPARYRPPTPTASAPPARARGGRDVMRGTEAIRGRMGLLEIDRTVHPMTRRCCGQTGQAIHTRAASVYGPDHFCPRSLHDPSGSARPPPPRWSRPQSGNDEQPTGG